jgi:hypothetical protein
MNHEVLEGLDDLDHEHFDSLHLNGSHYEIGIHMVDQAGYRGYSAHQTLTGTDQA